MRARLHARLDARGAIAHHALMPKSRTDAPETESTPPEAPTDVVAAAIIALIAARGEGKSICPTDAARAIAATRGETDDLAWRRWLPPVRAAAVGLARAGRLVIYRKGKPADPDNFRGVVRYGLPRHD